MTTKKNLLLVGLAITTVTCASALMTAPPGSSLTLTANPEFIPNNGGISVLSAFVIEPAGTTVPDGTYVQFFTTLGRVDPAQARTKDGIAHANLISDSRSGTANVTAVSGGAAVAPVPSPSASPGPQPITAAATATIPVRIGAVLPARVIVTADPSRITDSRSTHIFATVVDNFGNPVSNVGVIFTVGSSTTEFMDSEGHPIFTDTNGRAEDVLRTRRTVPGTVTVNVTVISSNNVTGSVTVPILLQ